MEKNICVKTIAMPSDANWHKTVYGGWIISTLIMGGAVLARESSKSDVICIGVKEAKVVKPLHVGDVVTCYGKLAEEKKASMIIECEMFISRNGEKEFLAAQGLFTYVPISEDGKIQRTNSSKID